MVESRLERLQTQPVAQHLLLFLAIIIFVTVEPNKNNPSEYIVTPVTGSLSVTKDGNISSDDANVTTNNGEKLTTIKTTRDMINGSH